MVEALHFSAPLAAPPPALEERLLAALTAAPSPAPLQTAPIQTAPLNVGSSAPMPAPAVSAGRAWLWPRVAWVAGIAAVFLLGLNLAWLSRLEALRTENTSLYLQMAQQATVQGEQQAQIEAQQRQIDEQTQLLGALRNQEAALGATLADQTDLLAQVVAAAGESYDMPPAQPGDAAFATVAWLDQAGVGVLRADNFPPLPPGMAYQFWLRKDGGRISAGLFTVDESGRGSLVFTPAGSLEEFDGMDVTAEPAGGSPSPTAPPVVIATLQHS
jgi:anti-sigma-K factor RskA